MYIWSRRRIVFHRWKVHVEPWIPFWRKENFFLNAHAPASPLSKTRFLISFPLKRFRRERERKRKNAPPPSQRQKPRRCSLEQRIHRWVFTRSSQVFIPPFEEQGGNVTVTMNDDISLHRISRRVCPSFSRVWKNWNERERERLYYRDSHLDS